MFEGVRGRSYQGDIALDDITVKSGECVLPGMFDINVRSAVHRSRSFALFCRSRSWSLFTSGKTPAALICAANFYHRSTKN